MNKIMNVDSDAFSDGQIGSKLWLCEVLESLQQHIPQEPVIWIFGGWYGLLAFLIFSRDRIRPRGIRSFDQDAEASPIADRINNHWEFQAWKFKSHVCDVNELSFDDATYGARPQIVINTSCEHFALNTWWNRIPKGTVVVLQAADMDIPDHVAKVSTIEEFQARFPDMSSTLFAGQKSFVYPNFRFSRFMFIGVK